MIEVQHDRPKNRKHFSRLLEFCKEVLAVCDDLDIKPVLSGSLAVFVYTRNQAMSVNDIDLACSELEFPRLSRALEAKGIACMLKEWHVLQARKDDLKVEFDSIEYWMAGLPRDCDTLVIDESTFQVVSLPSLKELYRRGLVATAGPSDSDRRSAADRAKHAAIVAKYAALCAVP